MAIKLINKEFCLYSKRYKCEYLCDTDTDFENLPEAYTGSTAVSIESAKVQVVNTKGEWVPFGE